MQFRLIHIFILTAYISLSLVGTTAIPAAIGAEGAFGGLSVGLIFLGVFMVLVVIFFLRLPAKQRPSVVDSSSGKTIRDGDHWLDYLIIWLVGSLFVFAGCYLLLADRNNTLIPNNWWITLLPAILLMALYSPAWRYLRN